MFKIRPVVSLGIIGIVFILTLVFILILINLQIIGFGSLSDESKLKHWEPTPTVTDVLLDSLITINSDDSDPYVWEAPEFGIHLEENEIASRHLVDQTITVRGIIIDFIMPLGPTPGSILLKGRTSYRPLWLTLKPEELELAASLKKGDVIIAQGQFERVFIGDIILLHCKILKVE